MFNISHQYIQLFSSTLASTLAAWAMVPSVFAGSAVINLAYQGIMEDCQAFKANEDDNSLSVIGNIQQRTFEVLYDVGHSTVGFRAGAC